MSDLPERIVDGVLRQLRDRLEAIVTKRRAKWATKPDVVRDAMHPECLASLNRQVLRADNRKRA